MNHELRHFCAFSGIGGFTLGFQSEGFTTIGFSEIDPAACLVLKHWFPGIPNYGDIRNIGDGLREAIGRIDVLTGGPPCQPASLLGKRNGTSDERWLWPDTIRILGLLRPRYAVFENPPAILNFDGGRALSGIVSSVAAIGYDGLWEIISAAAFGAGHLRERVIFIFTDTSGDRHPQSWKFRHELHQAKGGHRQVHPFVHGSKDSFRKPPNLRGRVDRGEWWHENHTGIPVLDNGISAGLAESAMRCAGNAILPQVAQCIARAIKSQLLT